MTVRLVEPEILTYEALIVVVPAATAVTVPMELEALLTVAADGFDEVQTTTDVRFCVVLSEKVPVAVNCCAAPAVMSALAGVTVMDASEDELTVTVVEPEILPKVAVMDAVPGANDVALPLVPAIDAIEGADELQVARDVRSWVVLSEKVPVAVNCS